MSQPVNIPGMVNQSLEVLKSPRVETFERYESRGGMTHAAIYVAICSVIAAVLGIGGGAGGIISNLVNSLFGFFVFAGLVYYVGQQQGGTGTFDHVAYTFSLFWGPISVLSSVVILVLFITILGIPFIPLVGLAALVLNAWFAYMAVQSSMNLPAGPKATTTLVAAVVGTFVIRILTSIIF